MIEEKAVWLWRQRLGPCDHKPRNVSCHQKLEEAENKVAPEPPKGVWYGSSDNFIWSGDTDLSIQVSRTEIE